MSLKYEGYLFVDHRASPGMPGSTVKKEGSVYEAATLSCSHCRTSVIMNPERIRVRGHCPRCNEYLCDWCAAAYQTNKICRPFSMVIEELKLGITATPILARDLEGLDHGKASVS